MTRRFVRALTALVGLGLVVRIAYLVVIGRHLTFGLDAIWYELQAGTLGSGKGYVDPSAFYRTGARVPTATFPPLWPGLLAVAKLVGLGSETGYQVVGALVGSVTVALTGLVGRRVAGPRVGLVAAALVAVSPMLVAADGSLMAESLYVALVTAAVLAAYRAVDRPTVARFAVVGLLVGLATLTRSDGAIVVPLLAACTAWRVRPASAGRRVALGLATLAVAVGVLVPWTVRNAVQLHDTVPLSNNSGNLLVGANCASTYGGPMLGTWDASCVPDHPAGTPEGERAAADRSTGITYARSHVSRLPLVVVARSLRVWGLWNPADLTPLEVIESRNTTWQYAGWGFDLVALAVAVPGVVLLVRRRAVLAPAAAVVAAVMVTAATAYGSQRFALVAMPIVAVAAATTVLALVERARRQAPMAISDRLRPDALAR